MTKVSAIITAGGTSERFGSNKLLETINGKTVIETTISKFVGLVDEIIIPSGVEVKDYLLSSTVAKHVKFAPAGDTRQQSVYNGLEVCSKPDFVLIHDGARPFIQKDTIKKTIKMVKEKHAVVVGTFATDTLKEVTDGKILETLDRRFVFHAQTPQAFDYELIKTVHEAFKDNDTFTDDSSMAEKYGAEVFILEAPRGNIKITTKEDLA